MQGYWREPLRAESEGGDSERQADFAVSRLRVRPSRLDFIALATATLDEPKLQLTAEAKRAQLLPGSPPDTAIQRWKLSGTRHESPLIHCDFTLSPPISELSVPQHSAESVRESDQKRVKSARPERGGQRTEQKKKRIHGGTLINPRRAMERDRFASPAGALPRSTPADSYRDGKEDSHGESAPLNCYFLLATRWSRMNPGARASCRARSLRAVFLNPLRSLFLSLCQRSLIDVRFLFSFFFLFFFCARWERTSRRRNEREILSLFFRLGSGPSFFFFFFSLLLQSFRSLATSRIIQSFYRSRPPELLSHAYWCIAFGDERKHEHILDFS